MVFSIKSSVYICHIFPLAFYAPQWYAIYNKRKMFKERNTKHYSQKTQTERGTFKCLNVNFLSVNTAKIS